MSARFDLDAYLDRIGYEGPRAPTLDVLRRLIASHARTIPFENLNPWLRWPVHLDVESIQRKLVADRRGGYCFEQNLLLDHALRSLGFRVTGLAARILWKTAPGAVTPRGHMLLLVSPDGDDAKCVADVGFGVMTPTAPLRLEPDIPQETPHEPFRVVRAGDGFTLQAQVRKVWRSLYRFDLQEQFLPDYEITNWYLSNHPASHFVTGLIAARPDDGRRYTLQGTELAVRHMDGRVDRHAIRTGASLRQTLERVFRLNLPASNALDDALERLAGRSG